MKKYTLSITYVILLTLCVPFACLYIWLLTVLPIPWDALTAWADTFGRGLLVFFLFLLPVGIYWLAVLILGVLELVRSFKVYKTGDAAGCVNGMLIHKYGLVIFFAVNFIVMFLFYFILTSFCRGWPRRLLFPYLHRGLPLCLEHFTGYR